MLPSKLGEPPYENRVPSVYTVRAWLGSAFATTKFELILGAKIIDVVTDIGGNPLADVDYCKRAGISIKSGVDGAFTLYVKLSTYTLVISKEGYRSVEIRVNVEQYESNVGVIRLEPSVTSTITVSTAIIVTQTITSPLTITETQTVIQTTIITRTTKLQ